MKIAMIGTGYVGLVSGTCFAEMGVDVVCVDTNREKIAALKAGKIPIYEPKLEELVIRNNQEGRLSFTCDIGEALQGSQIAFIAVGTPTGEDGSADLQYVMGVARDIGRNMSGKLVVVDKSTVPVGTAEKVRAVIKAELEKRGSTLEFDMVSNPEFLKEGAAVDDFLRPDRIVIGSDSSHAQDTMDQLYAPFVKNGHPLIHMDIASAEITKYAANCMLAARISFMNEMSILCEKTGADITMVRKGIGTDSRIGMPFLYAGLGYGGSCFPKDVKALIKSFQDIGSPSQFLQGVEDINQHQRQRFAQGILDRFGGEIKGKTFAVWGLAFKPNTDDMREAPAIDIIQTLCAAGATVRAFDPHAVHESKRYFTNIADRITYAETMHTALEGCDTLILVTEWNQFKNPDFQKIKALGIKTIFDGRNLYNPEEMASLGIEYHSIGR